ncbi:MAG: ADP-ribose pyrophosphatase [Spirochaetae bacterium HGW-Spirochaetae-1]|jgi:NADH pyrophosphatase NudC (nudix superfamily)|nr:MAG: ADP-ribose pyrophosphatase [Spirochaetae bacterium HGW-Spirochaetae-1]
MKKILFCPQCGSSLTTVTIEGKERPACPSAQCGYIHWDNPVPIVAALIEHEGSILLARNASWPEKIFSVITGFLESGEEPGEAVLRELKEELGLTGIVAGLIGLYNYAAMNQLIIAYHVKAEGEINLNGEIAETKHIPVEKLRPWNYGTGLAVRDWLEGRK